MKQIMRSLIYLAIVLTMVLTGCERRPLEVYYHNIARVRVDVDWDTYFGEKPSGMTMLLYKDGDQATVSRTDHNVTSQTFNLTPGLYKLMVFNLSPDEFGSLKFENLGSYNNATARARNITTRAPKKWDAGIRFMCDPEKIGVAVDTFEITEEMIKDYLVFVDYRQRNNLPDTTDIVYKEVVDPMTTHLNCRILVKGFNSMRSVEASISGMSDGFHMTRVDRTTETGIMLLDTWNATPIEGEDNKGWITTSISTFGLPFGKEKAEDRKEEDNVLTLAFLLKDGTVTTFTYNVGKIMKYLTPSGDALSKAEVLRDIEIEIILDDPIDSPDLPPVDPQDASGFDAHVDDWDEGETYEVSF